MRSGKQARWNLLLGEKETFFVLGRIFLRNSHQYGVTVVVETNSRLEYSWAFSCGRGEPEKNTE